jgi:hypothetical protein
MAALKAAVIGMGILIILGTGVLVAIIVQRLSAPAPAKMQTEVQATLDEPAGTRIAGVAADADRLALRLEGGGPDRVVVVDMRTGRVLARAGLAH